MLVADWPLARRRKVRALVEETVREVVAARDVDADGTVIHQPSEWTPDGVRRSTDSHYVFVGVLLEDFRRREPTVPVQFLSERANALVAEALQWRRLAKLGVLGNEPRTGERVVVVAVDVVVRRRAALVRF